MSMTPILPTAPYSSFRKSTGLPQTDRTFKYETPMAFPIYKVRYPLLIFLIRHEPLLFTINTSSKGHNDSPFYCSARRRATVSVL
jgi:hypothetical protein